MASEVGQGESLSVPHVFDLTEQLSPGEHRITIRVDNRVQIDVGENSHSVTDHTQTNWNGIVGTRGTSRQLGPSGSTTCRCFPTCRISRHGSK